MISKKEEIAIKILYKNFKYSRFQLMTMFNISQITLLKIVNKSDEIEIKSLSSDKINKLLDLYTLGKDTDIIAKELKCSVSTIMNVLNDFNRGVLC